MLNSAAVTVIHSLDTESFNHCIDFSCCCRDTAKIISTYGLLYLSQTNLELYLSQVSAQLVDASILSPPFLSHAVWLVLISARLERECRGFSQVTTTMFCFILLLVSCSLAPDLTLSYLNVHYGSRCVKLDQSTLQGKAQIYRVHSTGKKALVHAGPS